MISIAKRVLLGLLATAGIGVCIVVAGPLDPPAGPIASTGKTLTDIEPRVAINAVNTPGIGGAVHSITSPGSYYLTANLAVPPGRLIGIEIFSSDVTLDLNGFTINGQGTTLHCIRIANAAERARVFHGTVTASTSHGITATGTLAELIDINAVSCSGNGIDADDSARVIGCAARGNSAHGIRVGSNSSVADCVVANNAVNGIEALFGSRVTGCVLTTNGVGVIVGAYAVVSDCRVANGNSAATIGFQSIGNAPGVTLTNCSVSGSGGRGFWFPGGRTTLTNCAASGLTSNLNAFEIGPEALLIGCRSENNIGTGFYLSELCLVQNCISMFNTGVGFASPGSQNASYIACTASNNSSGFIVGDGATIRDCTANNNTLRGIAMSNGGMIEGCVTRSNSSHGIEVNFACTVRNNNCNGDGTNAASAIHVLGQANRIDSNNISYANVGLLIDSAGNIVIRNTCKGSAQNYFIAPGNSVAPIVAATTNATTISGDTYTGTLGTTDPNANFTY